MYCDFYNIRIRIVCVYIVYTGDGREDNATRNP